MSERTEVETLQEEMDKAKKNILILQQNVEDTIDTTINHESDMGRLQSEIGDLRICLRKNEERLDNLGRICRHMSEMYLELTKKNDTVDAKEFKRLKTLVEYHGLDEE